jgi:hypothetical protein
MSPIESFLELLRAPVGARVFNPWTQVDVGTDVHDNAAAERLQRLRAHLNVKARLLLVGEAPGYQGCHVSGIAFTSERLLLAGSIPRVEVWQRLSTRALPWSEPSATTVWGTLHELAIAEHTLLWNAFPWHPHNEGQLQTNRTPTPAERRLGVPVLQALLRAQPKARVLAVGRTAAASLQEMGLEVPTLRHPSMGGAAQFRAQLRETVK